MINLNKFYKGYRGVGVAKDTPPNKCLVAVPGPMLITTVMVDEGPLGQIVED